MTKSTTPSVRTIFKNNIRTAKRSFFLSAALASCLRTLTKAGVSGVNAIKDCKAAAKEVNGHRGKKHAT